MEKQPGDYVPTTERERGAEKVAQEMHGAEEAIKSIIEKFNQLSESDPDNIEYIPNFLRRMAEKFEESAGQISQK